VILTGAKIKSEVLADRIHISPFNEDCLEPNSYGFSISDEFIEYDKDEILDTKKNPKNHCFKITEEGYVLQPQKVYLGRTLETMGSNYYAKTLHARFSISSMGMWIHFSAPLGHTGAIIPWTLEILVAQPIRIYPYIKVGKIAFWTNEGELNLYEGKYRGSKTVVASRSYIDYNK